MLSRHELTADRTVSLNLSAVNSCCFEANFRVWFSCFSRLEIIFDSVIVDRNVMLSLLKVLLFVSVTEGVL